MQAIWLQKDRIRPFSWYLPLHILMAHIFVLALFNSFRAVRDFLLSREMHGKVDGFITLHTYAQLWIHPYSHEVETFPANYVELVNFIFFRSLPWLRLSWINDFFILTVTTRSSTSVKSFRCCWKPKSSKPLYYHTLLTNRVPSTAIPIPLILGYLSFNNKISKRTFYTAWQLKIKLALWFIRHFSSWTICVVLCGRDK